ncbi:hypothetical protein HPB48_026837 [Haemaphysalis longicornis]|uniref:Uncharacterized protein n=1 Tax=Haemaphysalis longicornis TaxID=44386 RepID=A0A9J6HAR9_HAELO|nr:hypothetical protein HPB48_026837 [Haemaphysalis longicornis]
MLDAQRPRGSSQTPADDTMRGNAHWTRMPGSDDETRTIRGMHRWIRCSWPARAHTQFRTATRCTGTGTHFLTHKSSSVDPRAHRHTTLVGPAHTTKKRKRQKQSPAHLCGRKSPSACSTAKTQPKPTHSTHKINTFTPNYWDLERYGRRAATLPDGPRRGSPCSLPFRPSKEATVERRQPGETNPKQQKEYTTPRSFREKRRTALPGPAGTPKSEVFASRARGPRKCEETRSFAPSLK